MPRGGSQYHAQDDADSGKSQEITEAYNDMQYTSKIDGDATSPRLTHNETQSLKEQAASQAVDSLSARSTTSVVDHSLDGTPKNETEDHQRHDGEPNAYAGAADHNQSMREEYGGTGLSDDGRSLTPDPHSSEAETEHIMSSGEDEPEEYLTQEQQARSLESYAQSHESYPEDDIPADLDALSDAESTNQHGSQGSELSDVDAVNQVEEEDEVEEEADLDGESEPEDLQEEELVDEDMPDENASPEVGALHHPTLEDKSIDHTSQAHRTPPEMNRIGSRSSPERKRKRSSPVSPGNSKRLAPRKVQADLDSDEEADESDTLAQAAAASLVDRKDNEGNTRAALELQFGKIKDAEAVETPETPVIPDLADEEEEGEEEEEVEEEVQDDNEREERNKHRQAAMDSLRQIEIEFTKLRAKLHEERMRQLDREIELAESGQHPLILQKTSQNQERHANRIRRAEILRRRRLSEADVIYRADKFVAHSQYAQDKQKLRATLLSKTSAEWFQIHREKRVIDMAVPEYGYVVAERKSVQAKQRRDYEAEVNILTGLKKFIGFPAAPIISVASNKDIDADMMEIGIYRSVGISGRENHKVTHVPHQHNVVHSHATMSTHLNHHSHSQHAHAVHPTSHNKNHHRKQSSMSQGVVADKLDHHSQSHYLNPRSSSPQIAPRQQSHPHTYHNDNQARKQNVLPATFGSTHDVDRKVPILHPLDRDAKPHDTPKDRLPFPTSTLPHPQSGAFHRENGSLGSSIHFGQKQAQNLPSILRQDTPDAKSKQQLPTLSHLASSGTHSSGIDYTGSNSGKSKFATQFWSPKSSETGRAPLPALSSNSAFNATLSQPGASAAYIPPSRAFSPANQNTVAQQQQPTSSQPNPVKPFQTGSHFVSSNSDPSTNPPQHSSIYSSKAQHNLATDPRSLFGSTSHPQQPEAPH